MDEGRALDVMIAEKVLGYVWLGIDDGAKSWKLLVNPLRVAEYRAIGWREPRGEEAAVHDYLLRFSSDIAAAFDVVANMHARVFAHSCAPAGEVPQPWPNANYLTLVSLGGAPDSGYAAAFTCVAMCDDDLEWFENPEKYGGAQGSSPAHAICLAALAALNAENPEPSHVV